MVQAPNTELFGLVQTKLISRISSAPPVGAVGEYVSYFNGTELLASVNGEAFAPITVVGATDPAGAPSSIQFNDNGVFGGFGSWNGSLLDIGADLSASTIRVGDLLAIEITSDSYLGTEAVLSGVGPFGGIASSGDSDLGATKVAMDGTINVGVLDSGNRPAAIVLFGDDTGTYGVKLSRGETGVNAWSSLSHKGTGRLYIHAEDSGSSINLKVNGVTNIEITDDIISTNCGVRSSYAIVSTPSTLSRRNSIVEQDTAGIVSSLWAAATKGDRVTIKNSSSGTTTIDGNGNNIDGHPTFILFAGEPASFVYSGTEWKLM